MNDYQLSPEPAQWALNAGLPKPHPEEGFIEYVERIGLDATELLEGLHERTVCLANYRLNTQLQRQIRPAFDAHVQALSRIHLSDARRAEVRRAAELLWGEGCRPRAVV